MAQFDVYARRGGPGFVIDCQADVLGRLVTRFVLPLLPRAAVPTIIAQLNPIFVIAGGEMVLLPQNAATVPVRELGEWIVSLEAQRYVISNAFDFLTTGY